MADLANPVRRVRCISIEQVKNCLEAWLMVRSALRSAYYGFVPGDRAARGLPGSCPPTCWTPTDPELFCCQVVNLAGLSHCDYAGMVPAGRHIEGTAKPPARWAKCSSAVFISGEPGEALLWGRRGGTRNQHQHETSRQQSGGDEFLRPPNRSARCHPASALALA